MSFYRIRDLLQDEKPREKMTLNGESSLADSELLALILQSGGRNKSAVDLGRDLIQTFESLGKVISADVEQLKKQKNVGLAKAAALKAAHEIAKRVNSPKMETKTTVAMPEDIVKCVKKDLRGKDKEHVYILTLDIHKRLISKDLLSVGTLNETLVHPREVFRTALAKGAASIALAHNHPSGEVQPSMDDVKVTVRIARAGREMGIPLLDHVVVCNDRFYSMKTAGIFDLIDKGGESFVQKVSEKIFGAWNVGRFYRNGGRGISSFFG
jgi:DNA repair protein RadC